MSDISKERREPLREAAESCQPYGYPVLVRPDVVLALLDMADERDRLRAFVQDIADFGGFKGAAAKMTLDESSASLNGSQS